MSLFCNFVALYSHFRRRNRLLNLCKSNHTQVETLYYNKTKYFAGIKAVTYLSIICFAKVFIQTFVVFTTIARLLNPLNIIK